MARPLFKIIFALMLAACSSRESPRHPEGSVHLFISAARAGDRAAVFQRLGPKTRARIASLLGSSPHQGGRLVSRSEDYLSVGWAPPAWEPAGVRLMNQSGDHALVEVFSAAGDRHSLSLVLEDKEWKIELSEN